MASNPYTPEANRDAQEEFRRKALKNDMSTFSLGYIPNSLKKRYWAFKNKKQLTHIEVLELLLSKAGG